MGAELREIDRMMAKILLLAVFIASSHAAPVPELQNPVPTKVSEKDPASLVKLQNFPFDGIKFSDPQPKEFDENYPTDPKYFAAGEGCCTTYQISGITKQNFAFASSTDARACLAKRKPGSVGADFQPMPCAAATVMYAPGSDVAELPCPKEQAELAKAADQYTHQMHELDGKKSVLDYNKRKLDEVKKMDETLTAFQNDPMGAKKSGLLKSKAKELAKVEQERTAFKQAHQNALTEAKTAYLGQKDKLEKEIAEGRASIKASLAALTEVRGVIRNTRLASEKTIEDAAKTTRACSYQDPSLPPSGEFGC